MDADDFAEILAAVRSFVRNEVVPAEDRIEADDEIPPRIREQAAAMGLFGFSLPAAYGGLGCSMTEEARLVIELGYTTPALRSMVGTNNGIAGQVLVNIGTERQRQRWLPGLATGELVAAFALTEAEAGSDPSGMRTKARRDGDHYVVTGEKRFITNAPQAQVLMTFARTGEVSDGTKGISVFVVDTSLPGVTIGSKDHKMGHRGAISAEVHYDEVRVPADCLVGEVEGEGFSAAMRSLARGRIQISALSVGIGERLVDESVAAIRDTNQGGAPIARFQLVQGLLAESQTDLYAARATVLAAAAAYDDGSDLRLGPSCCKLFCTEAVGRIADRAVQLHGGMGYMHGVPAERLYRDVRLLRLYEGTSEIQKVIIAGRLVAAAAAARG